MRDSVTLDKPFNRSYTVLGLSWGSCISGAHSKKTSLWQLGRQYCKFWITLDKILKIALGFSCSRRTKQPWRNTSEADNKVNIITVLMTDFKEVDIHVFCGPTRARYQITVAVLVSTQAEIRTSFEELYRMMSQREEFRWMMLRIKRMAEPWVSAIRSLAAKQNLGKRRKKKVGMTDDDVVCRSFCPLRFCFQGRKEAACFLCYSCFVKSNCRLRHKCVTSSLPGKAL